MATLIRRYESDRAARFIDFTPWESDQILASLARRESNVGMTLDSRLSDDDRKRTGRLQNAVLGRFAVGVAVNAQSPLRTIAVDDLAKIFGGQVASWNDIHGSGLTRRSKFSVAWRSARKG